jgi:hypothetical protein
MQASDSIQQPTPDRCPDRQRLAEAIEARTSAQTAVDMARDAVARGRDVAAAAEERLEEARAATATSRAQRAQELAHIAEGGTTALANPTRKARAEEADAEDDADAARSALHALRERLGEAEDAVRAAEQMVVAHVDRILRSVAERVLADGVEAALRFQHARVLLRFLQRPEAAGRIPTIRQLDVFSDEDGARLGERRAWQRARAADAARQVRDEGFDNETVERHLSQALQNIYEHEKAWTLAPELGAWCEARAALMHDPDAPLPA